MKRLKTDESSCGGYRASYYNKNSLLVSVNWQFEYCSEFISRQRTPFSLFDFLKSQSPLSTQLLTRFSSPFHLRVDSSAPMAPHAESAPDSATRRRSSARPRLFIKEMVMRNFKSYAGEQRVGPFHKVT